MVLTCDICVFKGASYQHLVYHYVIIHGHKAWSCKYCDYISKKKNKVIRHSKSRHIDEMINPYDGLDNYFTETVVVPASQDHFLCYFNQLENQTFKCIFCNEFVLEKDELSNHLRSEHLPSQFFVEEFKKDFKHLESISEDSFHCVCKLCHSSCTDNHIMADHVLASHPINLLSDKYNFNVESLENSVSTKFKCSECLYTTFVLDNFHKHLQKHVTSLSYKCNQCSFSTDYQMSLQKHKRYRHTESKTLTKTYLKKKIDVEEVETELISPLQCTICRDKIYKSIKTLKSHMKIKHAVFGNEDSLDCWEDSSQDSTAREVVNFTLLETSVFRCEFCHLDFKMFDSLASHYTNFHRKDVMSLKCDQCSFTTNQVSILTSHIATHNQPPTEEKVISPKVNEMIFQCPICSKKVHNWAAYTLHRKTHNKKSSSGFKCSKCSFVATDMRYLRQHQVKHASSHAKQHYSRYYRHCCDFCPYRAKNSTHFASHIKSHNKSNYRYRCHHCSYSCDNMCFLTKHARVHTKEYAERFAEGDKDKTDLDQEVYVNASDPIEYLVQGEAREMADDIEECVENCLEKSRLVDSKILKVVSLVDEDSDNSSKDEEFVKDSGLEKGMLLHCEKCPFVGESVEVFINHTSLHFQRRAFQCFYCDYSVPSLAYELIHRTLHQQSNHNLIYIQSTANLQQLPEMLDDLPEATIDRNHYSRMYEFSSEFTFDPVKLFNCSSCPFSSPHRSNFLRHLRGHNNQYTHQCLFCTFTDTLKNEISSHMAIHFNLPGCTLSSQLEVNSVAFKKSFLSKIHKQFDFKEDWQTFKNIELKMETENECMVGKKNVSETGMEARELPDACLKQAVVGRFEKDMSLDKSLESSKNSQLVCRYCSRSFELPSHLYSHESSHTKGSVYLLKTMS